MRILLGVIILSTTLQAAVTHRVELVNETDATVQVLVEAYCNPVEGAVFEGVLAPKGSSSVSFDSDSKDDMHCLLVRYAENTEVLAIEKSRFDGRVCQIHVQETEAGMLLLKPQGCGATEPKQSTLSSGALAAAILP